MTRARLSYSSFRRVDVPALRKLFEAAMATPPAEAIKTSPLKMKAGSVPLPKYYSLAGPAGEDAAGVVGKLNAQGYWLAPLGYNSHPYQRDGSAAVVAGDYSQTHVGDDTDTSPFPDDKLMGIAIEAYVRNMGILIRALEPAR